MNEIPLSYILFVSTALFFIGMYGLFTRRNMITMLMAIELMLNSVNINFVLPELPNLLSAGVIYPERN